MANLSNRDDLAGTPSKATTQAALTALYDFVASRFARGTAGVAAATDAELLAARVSLGLGSVSGRNKVINGHFQINQRVYGSGVATTAANQYTLDRWRVVVSGQSLTWTTSGNGRLVTAPSGGMEQVIKGANIEGGTYVLNWSGTATAEVNGVGRAKGEAFTLSANANVVVRFVSGTVDLVQLELNGVSPFEYKSESQELRDCRLYFRKSYAQAIAPGAVSSNGAMRFNAPYTGTNHGLMVQLGEPMHAPPTAINVYDPSSGVVGRIAADASWVSASVLFAGDGSFYAYTPDSVAAQVYMMFHYTLSAEL